MTTEQKYKLRRAIESIEDSVNLHDTDPKILSIWLSVAGDYCHEIAKEILKKQ